MMVEIAFAACMDSEKRRKVARKIERSMSAR
jgi:hypothetical protein